LKIFIETYGCQMNSYDSTAIAGILEHTGHTSVKSEEDADAILINTCSVRDHAEHKILSRIGSLRIKRKRAKRPRQIIGICGCMAERLGKKLHEVSHRPDLIAGVDQYEQLPQLLENAVAGNHKINVATGHLDDVHYVAPVEAYPVNNSHLVTIHKGCDYKCTYCIVPSTRGPQREKSPIMILDEIKNIVDNGGNEVTLLGQNVTAYNAPGMNFAKLLMQVSKINGLDRIRFLTSHPCDIDDELIETIADLDSVCPWLHIPAQSGSDIVLKRMKRYYKVADYMHIIEQARKMIPDVTFSGDFIVGFPGETDADFKQTIDLVRAVKYDQAFCFKYSERPGTPACKLSDDIAIDIKKERLAELLEVQEEVWQNLAKDAIGKEWTAVVEGKTRHSDNAVKARTANNRKIIVDGINSEPGDIISVQIIGAKGSSFLGKAVTANTVKGIADVNC
jgi:tRNA-2-methylthio-N6-dimethylallyladenosine synthase